jgi:hypothetical protein
MATSAFVKVFECRPMKVERRAPGPAYAKPPMEETAGCVARWRVRRYGDLTAVVPECEHNFCDMARTLRVGENTFRRPCNFKELRVVKKGTYCNLCAMCLMAAFVPHRPNKYFHVTASNGIVSSSPYTPLAIMTASPIASVRVFETSAMQMSSRYVRCAPNAVDDRSRDHHAERSSVVGGPAVWRMSDYRTGTK